MHQIFNTVYKSVLFIFCLHPNTFCVMLYNLFAHIQSWVSDCIIRSSVLVYLTFLSPLALPFDHYFSISAVWIIFDSACVYLPSSRVRLSVFGELTITLVIQFVSLFVCVYVCSSVSVTLTRRFFSLAFCMKKIVYVVKHTPISFACVRARERDNHTIRNTEQCTFFTFLLHSFVSLTLTRTHGLNDSFSLLKTTLTSITFVQAIEREKMKKM